MSSGGPSKINPISILFVGGLIFGVYCGVRFAPAYWTQWQVKEVLRDACSQLYQVKRFGNASERIQAVEASVHESIRKLGIDDPETTVEFPDDEPGFIVARASYSQVIRHPIGKPTTLHFTPEVRLDAKPVDWDKKK